MGETHQQATTSSRLGMRSGDGEIVEVQGGHIVRSTGRKDRHSKVCTAKGPRDRRVRLSAHTAIQFYDVQDRLGYDRPSKAVDWLIKKAKTAIDELAQLPAWHPTATTTSTPLNQNAQHQHQHHQQQQENMNEESVDPIGVDAIASTSRRTNTPVGGTTSFLPPSLDRDIADTIKTFFPMVAPTETTSSSSIQFQNYPPDLLSRTSSTMNQDLRLSLHSFQDPIMLHHQHHNHHHNDQALFAGTTALGFEGWPEHHHSEEHGGLQRMVAWNAGADTGNSGGGGGGGGFIFNSPSLSPSPSPALFGHSQYLSQRGPLQSSNNPSIRAWIDPPITSSSVTDHHPHQHQHHLYLHHHYLPPAIHQSSFSGTGYSSGGFSGFRIPARIQGEEEHDGVSDKPSSASSDSRH